MNNVYNNINIVEEVRKIIEKEKLKNDIPHMEQMVIINDVLFIEDEAFSIQKIKYEIELLKTRTTIPYYRDLVNHKKLLKHINVFLKRLIRKLLKFLVEPIVQEQSDLNKNIIKILDVYQNELVKKDKEIKELQERININSK